MKPVLEGCADGQVGQVFFAGAEAVEEENWGRAGEVVDSSRFTPATWRGLSRR